MNDDMARISVDGNYSLFTFRDACIKFRTSTKLKKYLRVKEWDNGYLVVDVDYSTLGETEEYVDITSILDDLYIDTQRFLRGYWSIMFDQKKIADEADVIIDGYAFIKKKDNRITIVNLNREGHAALIFPSGEVVETSMDEIELSIAMDYLERAKSYMEESYA